jgi:hypothetical protein
MPSTFSPLRAWNAFTACFVRRAKTPSAGMPSARWIAATAGPFEPSLSMPPFCAAVADVS